MRRRIMASVGGKNNPYKGLNALRFFFDTNTGKSPTLFLSFKPGMQATVDWGDGSIQDVSSTSVKHDYENYGEYVVKIDDTIRGYAVNNDNATPGASDYRYCATKGVVELISYLGDIFLGSAFYGASNLSKVCYFKNTNKLEQSEGRIGIFAYTQFDEIDFANCESIGNSAFFRNTKLSKIGSLDGCRIIKTSAFYGCSSLNVDINLVDCEIGDSAFYESGIKSLSCNSVTALRLQGSEPNITTVILPSLRTIGYDCYYVCPKLSYMEVGEILSIRETVNSSPFGGGTSNLAPADESGVKFTLKCKNTMDSFLALGGVTTVGLNYSYKKIVCSDGYVRWNGSSFVKYPDVVT